MGNHLVSPIPVLHNQYIILYNLYRCKYHYLTDEIYHFIKPQEFNIFVIVLVQYNIHSEEIFDKYFNCLSLVVMYLFQEQNTEILFD